MTNNPLLDASRQLLEYRVIMIEYCLRYNRENFYVSNKDYFHTLNAVEDIIDEDTKRQYDDRRNRLLDEFRGKGIVMDGKSE